VTEALIRFLVNEIRVLDERLLEALYLPVERRVRRRLAELCEPYRDANGTAEITLTQEAIADLAGAKRPIVNRVLRPGRRTRLIELMRGRIRVVDVDELRKRAR
jgi:CRP-like cAMP-binding protein